MALFGSQQSTGSTEMEMNRSAGMDRESMSTAERKGGDMAIIAAAASVLLSWYEFYGRDNKIEGLFVGLWAPTLLGFATYLKQRSMEDQMKSMPLFGSDASKTLRRLLG